MKKIKILYIHPNLKAGGAEEIRLTFLKHIDRTRYDVTLYCIGEKGRIGKEIEALGYRVHEEKGSLRFLNIFTLFKILKYMNGHHFDIVHMTLSIPNFYGRIAAMILGIRPIIVEEQNYYERYPRGLRYIFKKINQLLSRGTSSIIANSEAVKQYLIKEEKVPEHKILTLYNAIDPDKFIVKKSKEELRAVLGLRQNPVLGYVASFSERKGHVYLIKSFQKVLQSYPNAALLLIGEGQALERELRAYVEANGLDKSVVFMGLRRDIPQLLTSMDVFVASPLKEAFGINLAEAMYMRIPCVATNVGGVPEVIKDRETGILVPPADPDTLAEAVKELLDKPELAKRYSEAGKKRVEELFFVDEYKTKLEALYSELLYKEKD